VVSSQAESLAILVYLSDVRWGLQSYHTVILQDHCNVRYGTYTPLKRKGISSFPQLSLSRGLNGSMSTLCEADIAGSA
jgi:hypothetical protein